MFKIKEINGLIDIKATKKFYDSFDETKYCDVDHEKVSLEHGEIRTDLKFELEFFLKDYIKKHENDNHVKNIKKFMDYCKKNPDDTQSDQYYEIQEQYIESSQKIFTEDALRVIQIAESDCGFSLFDEAIINIEL